MSVLELLKNDAEYYKGIGRNYLSNSDIGTLLSNPQMYGVPLDDSKALHEGRYFHQLMIEPEKARDVVICDVSSRTTKEYKRFCEENMVDFCLLEKEADDIRRLVGVMRNNMTFFDEIYKQGNEFEVPAVGTIHGMNWKGKADIVAVDCLIDLKTTSDINKFKYSARNYNYDSQCFIYETLFGKPLKFFVIDKQTAQLGIFKPSEPFLESGEAKVKAAIEVYNRFFGPNPIENIDTYYIEDVL